MVDSFEGWGCGGAGLVTSDYWLPDGPRLSGQSPLTLAAPAGVTFSRVDPSYGATVGDDRTSWGGYHIGTVSLETWPGRDSSSVLVAAPPPGVWAIHIDLELDDSRTGVHWSGGYTFGLTILR